ncbi:MAG: NfeD family protein [Oscillospiraceae bacterium]
MEGYIWLALIILGIIIEAASPQLVSIWFVLGAVAALVASFFGVPVWGQVLLAIVVSIVALVATKPLVKRIVAHKFTGTNADRYIGKEGIVITEINDVMGTGRVMVLGSSWSAISPDVRIIPAGTKVFVEKIEGVKLLVKILE